MSFFLYLGHIGDFWFVSTDFFSFYRSKCFSFSPALSIYYGAQYRCRGHAIWTSVSATCLCTWLCRFWWIQVPCGWWRGNRWFFHSIVLSSECTVTLGTRLWMTVLRNWKKKKNEMVIVFETRHDKTCLREFPTRPDINRPAQPQKLASLEFSAIESRDIILSKQRTIKMLIRLRRCAVWSAPVLYAFDIRHIYSWPGSYAVLIEFFPYYYRAFLLAYLVSCDKCNAWCT